jgi:hypothetical protein
MIHEPDYEKGAGSKNLRDTLEYQENDVLPATDTRYAYIYIVQI